MDKNWFMKVIIFIIVLLSLSISGLTLFVTDYFWFEALGFEQIFLITLFSKIKLFVLAAATFFIFATINILISSRFENKKKSTFVLPFKLKLLIITALSAVIGFGVSSEWFKALQFMNQTSFNLIDPIFAASLIK